MIDAHTHLENGPLSVEYVMQFVEAAKANGITTLHILDHTHRFVEFAPMYEPLKACDERQKQWFDKKVLEPLSKYHEVIETMKQMDLGIEVKFGLEVCYAPQDKEFIKGILSQYPYDFVIGSIHSIDARLYDMKAFSHDLLWDRFDVNEIYKRYYEILADMIESDLFTQIGHPDQLKLFGHVPSYDLVPTYEYIAKLAKVHDVYMEHNTGIHYRYGHEDQGTNEVFLNILKKHGVKLITASDAHVPKHVGMLAKEASEAIL